MRIEEKIVLHIVAYLQAHDLHQVTLKAGDVYEFFELSSVAITNSELDLFLAQYECKGCSFINGMQLVELQVDQLEELFQALRKERVAIN